MAESKEEPKYSVDVEFYNYDFEDTLTFSLGFTVKYGKDKCEFSYSDLGDTDLEMIDVLLGKEDVFETSGGGNSGTTVTLHYDKIEFKNEVSGSGGDSATLFSIQLNDELRNKMIKFLKELKKMNDE
jgi:hypothetical protein